MKLLTTITALLLSLSAFSQDLIEYQNSKFYQNGSEISFEEVTELTKEYGVARVVFRQGRRDFAASESRVRRIRRNLTHGILVASTGVGTFIGFTAGWVHITGGFSFAPVEPDPSLGAQWIALGTASSGLMIHSARQMGTKKQFKKRADRKFSKTSHKLNEAVQLSKNQ